MASSGPPAPASGPVRPRSAWRIHAFTPWRLRACVEGAVAYVGRRAAYPGRFAGSLQPPSPFLTLFSPMRSPMPINKEEYPDNWPEISHRIRFERAGGRCECDGRCGRHKGRCGAQHGKPHPQTGSIVWLTTAHLGVPKPDGSPGNKRDKMDCREENLMAMCPACHLSFDVELNTKLRAENRYARQLQNGQRELL